MTENPNSEIDSEKWANEFIGEWRNLANAFTDEEQIEMNAEKWMRANIEWKQ